MGNLAHHGYVLVVEDDADVREAITLVMEASGYEAVGAADGQEAMELLRSLPAPCIILLDLMMPRKDGWQFRAEQMGDPALADIPVIVLSALGRERVGNLPVSGFLDKPIDAGGLALSRYAASAVLLAAIAVCIAIFPQRAATRGH